MDELNEDPRPWYLNLILGVILLVLGGQGLTEQFGFIARGIQSKGSNQWTAVEAEIRGAEPVQRGNFLTGTGWLPQITYAYDVDGTRYTGDRFSFNDPADGLTESEATRLVAAFTADEKIEVYVDPDEPSQSTMIRGHDEAAPKGFLVDLLLVVIGIVMLWGALSDQRRTRHERHERPQ